MNRDFLSPVSALTWTVAATILAGLIGMSMSIGTELRGLETPPILLALLMITTVSAAVLGIVLILDIYRARNAAVLAVAGAAGATIVPLLASSANEYLSVIVQHVLSGTAAESWDAAIVGPLGEEWLKGVCVLAVLLLLGSGQCRPVHGFLAGAAVGLGFQFSEDLVYAVQGARTSLVSDFDGAVSTTALRVATSFAGHWIYSAVTGTGIAVLLGCGRSLAGEKRSAARGLITGLALIVTGWGFHFLWNSPVPDELDLYAVPVKTAVIITGFALITCWVNAGEGRYLAALAQREGLPFTGWRARLRGARQLTPRAARREYARQRRADLRAVRQRDSWSTAAAQVAPASG